MDEYLRKGKDAGTMCHKESGYLQELCQEAALKRRQNIWVDGSLRDTAWFDKVFADIRSRYPHYRIGIIAVVASEQTIRERIEKRRARTGRGAPEHLWKESMTAPQRAFFYLGPQCNWLVRVDNEVRPTLTCFHQVDHSQDWGIIKRHFAKYEPEPHEFPRAMSPIPLSVEDEDTFEFVGEGRPSQDSAQEVKIRRTSTSSIWRWRSSVSTLLLTPASVLPYSRVGPGAQMRKCMGLPSKAAWITYAQPQPSDACPNKYDKSDALLPRGGFVFLDKNKKIVGITRIGEMDLAETHHFLEFRAPVDVKATDIPEALRDERRWSPVTLPNLLAGGGRQYAWICPGELEGTYRPGYLYRLEEGSGELAARGCPNNASKYVFFPLRTPPV